MRSNHETPAGRSFPRAGVSRAEGWLVAAAVVILLTLFWSMLCTVPGVPWNSARLAPSFALARGLPIYALRDSGAQLGWFYGPVFPLWFLPVGFLDQPTIALMCAAGWNAVTLLLPVFATVAVALGGHPGAAARAALLGVVLLLANPITQSAFYMLHVDGVAIACSLLACASLQAGAVRRWRPGLPMAALAVALAVGTKQLAIVLVPASFLWLWREGHVRLLGAWLCWLAICGGAVAGLFLVLFGPRELWFNGWVVLSHMPWRGGMAVLAARVLELVQLGWFWWLALAIGWLALSPPTRVAGLVPGAAALIRLLGWVALLQLPLGVVASMRAGGGLNSLHALTFALVAGLIVAGSWLARRPAPVGPRRYLRPAFVLAVILVLGLALDFRLAVDRQPAWTPYRGLDDMLALARQKPGRLYMPWNPLITIISDHRVYPFDDALYCLWLAHLAPRPEAVRAAVPPEAMILYQEPSQSHFALRYFGPSTRPPKSGQP